MAESRYSPSVNIIRDQKKSVHYVPTSNSMRVYSQIADNFKNSNIRSFNLVGSYGTGKSAFLLAFEKHISNKQQIFGKKNGEFIGITVFDIFNFVGDYSSIIDACANKLQLKKEYTPFDVIHALDLYYKKRHNSKYCLIIVFDEFGKHLEYAVANEPEKEMYFVQLLAEYINDDNKNIILLTTLHQNIDAYGVSLDAVQRQEWNKVRGRLKEIPFLEPVEQLLSLAAEHITKRKFKHKLPIEFNSLFETIKRTKLFPLKTNVDRELAEKLYPMDLLSAAVLTMALQKYGQNERSLFSFLLNNDYLGINEYDFNQNDYYNISSVYDYLLNNFYTFLFTKYNPHYTQWAAIRSAIERVEGLFHKEINDYCKLIKTIGLLNIFSPESSVLDKDFLKEYGSSALKIKNIDEIIQQLETKKIIKYVLYKKKYILFEGSDLDIELALKEAGEKIDTNFDVVNLVHAYFEFPYLAAKKVHYEKGTPRFFEFNLSEESIKGSTKKTADGIINCVFPLSFDKTIKSILKETSNAPVLYGVYNNTYKIKETLIDILTTKHVIDTVHDDLVAGRELNNLLAHNVNLLNTIVFNSFYDGSVTWYFNGIKREIGNNTDLSKMLSFIIETAYHKTPIFRNELINRDKLPSTITLARKAFVKAMLNDCDKPDLNLPTDKYPPEKMIYKSLLRETGIHRKSKTEWILGEPKKDNDFTNVWNESLKFLESTKSRRRPLSDFIRILSDRPYGLKLGVIDFWISIFLFCKRDDFAIYIEDSYVSNIDEELIELFVKAPKKVEIKAFNVNGVKYELFQKYQSLIKMGEQHVSNKGFITTIKPFLKFYKQLPEYTKKTNNLKPHTKKFREAIAKAKDPEKTFFEDIPEALGFANLDLISNEASLQNYIDTVQESINELKFSFDVIINEIEEVILNTLGYSRTFDFNKITENIQKRYKSLIKNNSTVFQRNFLTRIEMSYDTKLDWISSIVSAVINKPLSALTDDEVSVTKERIRDVLLELEDLLDISKVNITDEFAKVLKVSLTVPGKQRGSKVVLVTNEKEKMMRTKIETIKKHLSGDSKENIDLLAYLLEEELSK